MQGDNLGVNNKETKDEIKTLIRKRRSEKFRFKISTSADSNLVRLCSSFGNSDSKESTRKHAENFLRGCEIKMYPKIYSS